MRQVDKGIMATRACKESLEEIANTSAHKLPADRCSNFFVCSGQDPTPLEKRTP